MKTKQFAIIHRALKTRFFAHEGPLAAAIVVCALLASSCSAPMMKSSPFYTGGIVVGKTSSGKLVRWNDPDAVKVEKIFAADIKSKMDDNRVYVWPLFYKNFLMYSVLWPLAEWNDIGWKIRPLVSVDDYHKEYRILTGGWSGKEDSHYIFPLYVKNPDSFYSIPFSYKGGKESRAYNYFLLGGYLSEDSSSYVFPLYYYDGGSSRLYTLICSFGKHSGYIFPLYFYDKSNKYSSHFLLLPLGLYESHADKNGKWHCDDARFFPLFSYQRRPITDQWRNPKYSKREFRGKQRPKDYWTYEKSVEKSLFILPLFYFSDNRKRQQTNNIVFPFYFQGYDKFRDKDEEWLSVVPFYFQGYHKGANVKKSSEWRMFIPFYAYSRQGKSAFWNYMLLAGKRNEVINGDVYNSSYFLPFYANDYFPVSRSVENPKYKGKTYEEAGEPDDYRITKRSVGKSAFYFPSIYSVEHFNGNYAARGVVPFYASGHDNRWDRDSDWTWWFPFYCYTREKESYYREYGVFFGTRDEKLLGKRYKSSFLFPIYGYDYDEEHYYTPNAKYAGKQFEDNEPDDYYIDHSTLSRSSYFFPTISKTSFDDGGYYRFDVYPFFSSGHSRRYRLDEEKWNYCFPFYFLSSDGSGHSWNYGCLLGGSEYSRNDNEKESTNYFMPLYYHGRVATDTSNTKADADVAGDTKEKTYTWTYLFPNIYFENNEFDDSTYFTFFPFLFREKTSGYEEVGTPFSIFYRKKSRLRDSLQTQFLWYAYYYNRTDSETTEFIFPTYYSYTDKHENHTITDFFPFTFYEKTNELDSFGALLWLYTSNYNFKKKEGTRQAFWYLYYNYYYKADGKKRKEDYESARLLWQLYHRETKGDTTNVDVFPFISYSKNKERSKFSFAWRFFSVESGKKGTKVHLLFIPVWW